MSKSIRERRRERARKSRAKKSLVTGGLIVLGVILVGALAWTSFGKPAIGEVVIATGEGDHLPEGSPLPTYSTNPPTSGAHYAVPLPEGFYEEDSPEAVSLPNPEGHIVHSMEHGYVIFWYNCANISESDCDSLKREIRSLMSNYNNFKIIAFPWASISVPIVATSWGRYLEFETWDADLAETFIENNRNKSPEPNAR
jgi:hypothetical protein